MNGQQLKNSILQMAVQGKLVPQNLDDEPASILLERIRAEKEELIKAKKIKKDTKESRIFKGEEDGLWYEKVGKEVRSIEEELPFEIPTGWSWARLGSVLLKLTDGTHNTPKYIEKGIPFLSVKDISSGKISFSNTKFISREEHNALFKRCDPEKDDILLTKVGTTGIPVLIDVDKEFSLFVSVALLKFNTNFLNKYFLVKLIQSPLVQSQCTDKTKGVGNKNWVIRDIANTLICIPPLIEQQRIVAKIEELLPRVNAYDVSHSQLEKLNTSFPNQMKKSLLQWAIQGKLIPQNENDEPASALVHRIAKEKEQLIKDKKIKKDKNVSRIFQGEEDGFWYEEIGGEIKCIEEELPFELPIGWSWVRLGICLDVRDGTHDTPKYIDNLNFPHENSRQTYINSSF